MSWSLIAFMETAAKNGLTAMTRAAGETLYAGTGDNIQVGEASVVTMATCVTAAIANYVQSRFRHTLDSNYVHLRLHVRDQTGAVGANNMAYMLYDVPTGSILNADADNGNNAQYEAVLLAITPAKAIVPAPRLVPTGLPRGCKWVSATGTATAVAGTWTNADLTFSETFALGGTYEILGMCGHSATGYAFRLAFKGNSPTKGYKPGVPMGDTAILNQVFYGNFGQFMGDQPPSIEVLCAAGDTAQTVSFLIRRLK